MHLSHLEISVDKKSANLIVATPQCIMSRERLLGSLKLYVSITEYNLFHRAVLQKRPIILRSLAIVATPVYHVSKERYMGWLRLVGS